MLFIAGLYQLSTRQPLTSLQGGDFKITAYTRHYLRQYNTDKLDNSQYSSSKSIIPLP